MNELKSVYIDRTGDWVRSGNDMGKFYLKSEADKVIEELKDEASTAHRVCSRQIQQIASNEQEIRHHKYKRCLAMYRYCAIKALYELDFKGNDVEWKWYSKWMHKWFELAEKFKEAK